MLSMKSRKEELKKEKILGIWILVSENMFTHKHTHTHIPQKKGLSKECKIKGLSIEQ